MASRQAFGTIIKSSSGRFRARYVHPDKPFKDDGKQNYVNAPTTYATKTEAREWLASVQADIGRKVWKSPEQVEAERVQAEIQAARDAWTFKDYATQWLEGRDLRPSTRRPSESYLDNHLLPYWADTPLKAITTAKVKEWLAVLAPGHEGARKKSYELFRAIMNTAVEDDLIPFTPCKRRLLNTVKSAPAPKDAKLQKKRPRRALTMKQLQALADEVPAYMATAVLWSGLAGFRPGEIRALQARNVWKDEQERLWVTIDHAVTGQGKHRIVGPTKTPDSNRPVPVPPSLVKDVEALASKAGESGYLFHSVGKPQSVISEATYWENMQNAGKRAGIGEVAPYDLRHTCVTRARELDGSGGTVTSALVGHTTTTMTDHYTHTSLDAVFKLVETLDRERERPAEVASLDQRRLQA